MAKHKQEREYSGLKSQDSLWVKHNIDELRDIVESGETWAFNDVSFDYQKIPKLKQMGLIESVKKEHNGISTWTTTMLGEKAINYWIEWSEKNDSIWPCECATTGIKNPRETDKLACPRCGELFDKKEMQL